MVAGDEGGLEYDMSQQTPAATDSALAAHGAAVMCNGCKAGEGGGLFTGDLSECPSSYKMGHQSGLNIGGSGSVV